MATDGTKIIDGDTAHDTYWGIMDLYDSEVELEIVLKEFPISHIDYFDDFDNEIYITACGLAYWELGLMTPKRLDYIKKTINKNACVNEWMKHSEKEGKARKSVLKRYLTKIEKPNTKIRKRKKYRKISNFVFNGNSILTFKNSTGEYAVCACIKINQYRGSCNYLLVPINYTSKTKPTVNKIKTSKILGRTIGNTFSREETKLSQPGIENIWNYMDGKPNARFGFIIYGIEHKNFIEMKDQFEKIGELNFINGLKEIGSITYVSSFEMYNEIYSNLDGHIKILGYKKYPIEIVIND